MTGDRIALIEGNLIPERLLWRNREARATLAERMAHYAVLGVSVAVINGGEIEWAWGFGLKEAGAPEPVGADTLFQAGSISKLVTAVAVLRLVEAGLLDLDEDVNKYLVSWRVPANEGWQPRVTLRQLLSHSAGTTVHGFGGYARESELPTLLQILNGEAPANSSPIYVDSIPGTQFRYSGGGTTIAQQLLMDAVGKPFPQIMRELVLEPAGMEQSTFEQPLPAARWADAATGHYWVRNQPIYGKWHTYPEMAAAGLWTTATDLARLAVELQGALAGKPDRLLSGEMAREMISPQVAPHMGIGPFLKGEGVAAAFGHPGSTHGFVADLMASRQDGWGAAIMTNSFSGESLIKEIRRAIAMEYGWPHFAPQERVAQEMDSALFGVYCGEYTLRSGLRMVVGEREDGLILYSAGQEAIAIYFLAEDRFFMKAVNAELEFIRGKDGKATGLALRQDGNELVAERCLSA